MRTCWQWLRQRAVCVSLQSASCLQISRHPLLLSALAEGAQLFDELLAAPEIVKCVLNFS